MRRAGMSNTSGGFDHVSSVRDAVSSGGVLVAILCRADRCWGHREMRRNSLPEGACRPVSGAGMSVGLGNFRAGGTAKLVRS